MRTSISQRELRNDSGDIMRRVENGESFVVTRNGVPVADLDQHVETRDARRRFVPVSEIAEGLAGLPDWGTVPFDIEVAGFDERLDDADRDPWNSVGE